MVDFKEQKGKLESTLSESGGVQNTGILGMIAYCKMVFETQGWPEGQVLLLPSVNKGAISDRFFTYWEWEEEQDFDSMFTGRMAASGLDGAEVFRTVGSLGEQGKYPVVVPVRGDEKRGYFDTNYDVYLALGGN
ncbi:hypothetical protein HOD38_03515 [archaeon]|mgnify:FL=1|jgi:hypothetical protein|nr:hypothetical protein [archaeon]MBT4397309.1 hypothetical protein [archaeon]MBT4440689.1 hypothetical protein [archaeon]